jgi:hypothetical protein
MNLRKLGAILSVVGIAASGIGGAKNANAFDGSFAVLNLDARTCLDVINYSTSPGTPYSNGVAMTRAISSGQLKYSGTTIRMAGRCSGSLILAADYA